MANPRDLFAILFVVVAGCKDIPVPGTSAKHTISQSTSNTTTTSPSMSYTTTTTTGSNTATTLTTTLAAGTSTRIPSEEPTSSTLQMRSVGKPHRDGLVVCNRNHYDPAIANNAQNPNWQRFIDAFCQFVDRRRIQTTTAAVGHPRGASLAPRIENNRGGPSVSRPANGETLTVSHPNPLSISSSSATDSVTSDDATTATVAPSVQRGFGAPPPPPPPAPPAPPAPCSLAVPYRQTIIPPTRGAPVAQSNAGNPGPCYEDVMRELRSNARFRLRRVTDTAPISSGVAR